ncbi:hypothetical protein F1654_13825 [Alkalicaulis satelles]|uniref:Uncharacterized protein n=2 Tax=Alkalicaulis satelles TaxID=2609175 RepID=A0A5M6Z8D8_9PROT|nr:hypothetical protein F1654_13825 [Alkalicaulis satelles]
MAGVFLAIRGGGLSHRVAGLSLALFLLAGLFQTGLSLAVFGQLPHAALGSPGSPFPWVLAGFLIAAAVAEEAARAVTNLRLIARPDVRARLSIALVWWLVETMLAVMGPAITFLDNFASHAADHGLQAALERADQETARIASGITNIVTMRLPSLAMHLIAAWLIAPGPHWRLRLAGAVTLHAAFNIIMLIVLRAG